MLEDCTTSNTVCTYAVHTFKVCKVYVRHIGGISNYNHIVRLLRLIQERTALNNLSAEILMKQPVCYQYRRWGVNWSRDIIYKLTFCIWKKFVCSSTLTMQTYTRILDVASVCLHSQLDLISDALAWNAEHQRADTYPSTGKSGKPHGTGGHALYFPPSLTKFCTVNTHFHSLSFRNIPPPPPFDLIRGHSPPPCCYQDPVKQWHRCQFGTLFCWN